MGGEIVRQLLRGFESSWERRLSSIDCAEEIIFPYRIYWYKGGLRLFLGEVS